MNRRQSFKLLATSPLLLTRKVSTDENELLCQYLNENGFNIPKGVKITGIAHGNIDITVEMLNRAKKGELIVHLVDSVTIRYS